MTSLYIKVLHFLNVILFYSKCKKEKYHISIKYGESLKEYQRPNINTLGENKLPNLMNFLG